MYYGDLNSIHGVETENAIVIIGNELIYDGNMVRCSEEAFDSEKFRKNLLCLRGVNNYRGRDLTDEEKNQLEKYLKNIYKVLLYPLSRRQDQVPAASNST